MSCTLPQALDTDSPRKNSCVMVSCQVNPRVGCLLLQGAFLSTKSKLTLLYCLVRQTDFYPLCSLFLDLTLVYQSVRSKGRTHLVIFYYNSFVWMFWLNVCVCARALACSVLRPDDGIGFPRIGITEGCEPQCRCKELNEGPLEEQPVS